MKLLKLFIIPVVILLASVPWLFTGASDKVILGFPVWAFYSLVVTIIYAIVIAVFLKRYWSLSAGDDDKEERE